VDVQLSTRTRREQGRELPLLVWRFATPVRVIGSAPHGGGVGIRRWAINAQVPGGYARRDPDHHLAGLGISLGLSGRGIGMLTAADVRQYTCGADGGVEATATVGLGHPIWAAAPDERIADLVGTINLLVLVPERLSEAALVNAVATATEAKSQALYDLGLAATGTATDALCIACPDQGSPAAFGGPRSVWGARIARAVHGAVVAGGRHPADGA
jgi:adenosylcobinamide hydrolase